MNEYENLVELAPLEVATVDIATGALGTIAELPAAPDGTQLYGHTGEGMLLYQAVTSNGSGIPVVTSSGTPPPRIGDVLGPVEVPCPIDCFHPKSPSGGYSPIFLGYQPGK